MPTMGRNFKLEDLSSYKIAAELADIIYSSVKEWKYIDQKTVGIQLIRSVDSIAANIAEGFGRYHKKDKIKFFYNARASVFESAHWVKTAYARDLIGKETNDLIMTIMRRLPKEINYLIKFTGINLTI